MDWAALGFGTNLVITLIAWAWIGGGMKSEIKALHEDVKLLKTQFFKIR